MAIYVLLKNENSIRHKLFATGCFSTFNLSLDMGIFFVDCALNAGADCIVTNDKHFNILKEIDFPKINIIDIDTFKKTIK